MQSMWDAFMAGHEAGFFIRFIFSISSAALLVKILKGKGCDTCTFKVGGLCRQSQGQG
jgi:hypothetical protein